MTTGTRIIDARVNVSFEYYPNLFSQVKIGPYSSRVWSGGDSIAPGTRPTKPKLLEPVRVYTGPPINRVVLKGGRKVLVSTRKRDRAAEQSILRNLERQRRLGKLKARLARLLLPPNNYTTTMIREFHGGVITKGPSVSKSIESAPYDPWKNGWASQPYKPSLSVDREYYMIERLRRKVYGSGFNPAVFCAEGAQSLSMIGCAAVRIRYALMGLKRRDPRLIASAFGWSAPTLDDPHRAKNLKAYRKQVERIRGVVSDTRRTTASKWLELKYGWEPLAGDMEEGAKWLAYAVQNTSQPMSRVTTRKQFGSTEVWSMPSTTANGTGWCERVVKQFVQLSVYGLQKSPTFVPSLATVASVAWEKLPYSFICDWVVPIGSYIQACRTASDLKGTFVKSVLSEVTYTRWQTQKSGNFQFRGFLYGPPSRQVVFFDRTVTSELVPPSPITSASDALSNLMSLSVTRTANAVALLAQRRFGAKASSSQHMQSRMFGELSEMQSLKRGLERQFRSA